MRITRERDLGDARRPYDTFYVASSVGSHGHFGMGRTPAAARADLRRTRREAHRRGPAVPWHVVDWFRDLASREETR